MIRVMLSKRGLNTIRITKRHADNDMIGVGVVEQSDNGGNGRADEAADLGRRHVGAHIMDARRKLSHGCHSW